MFAQRIKWLGCLSQGSIARVRKPADPARVKARVHLGRCLALARAWAGLSQEATAKALDVARPTLWAWESGGTEPLAVDMQRLADLYKLTLDQLAGRAPLPPLPEEGT